MQIHCSLEILLALLCEIILKNLKCNFIKKKFEFLIPSFIKFYIQINMIIIRL